MKITKLGLLLLIVTLAATFMAACWGGTPEATPAPTLEAVTTAEPIATEAAPMATTLPYTDQPTDALTDPNQTMPSQSANPDQGMAPDAGIIPDNGVAPAASTAPGNAAPDGVVTAAPAT